MCGLFNEEGVVKHYIRSCTWRYRDSNPRCKLHCVGKSDPRRPLAASDCRPGRAAAPRATHRLHWHHTTLALAPPQATQLRCTARSPPATAAASRKYRCFLLGSGELAGVTRIARRGGPVLRAASRIYLSKFLRPANRRDVFKGSPSMETIFYILMSTKYLTKTSFDRILSRFSNLTPKHVILKGYITL